MSFDLSFRASCKTCGSQSLWNRAMSFDLNSLMNFATICLNPFGTGQCLSTENSAINVQGVASLNPFGTGQCLSTQECAIMAILMQCLNPFGTGQCLSTEQFHAPDEYLEVSIPLEQGNVFRLQWGVQALCGKASQSHFPTFSDA